MLEIIMSVLLDPTALFWKFFIVSLLSFGLGATVVGGDRHVSEF